mgnify:CR=1 FL=1
MNLQQVEQDTQKTSIINRLLASVPAGVPMTTPWLELQGVSPQLARRYKLSGWLEPLGRSAWVRLGATVNVVGAVFAVQKQLSIKACPAARTALELQGRAHYVPVGKPVLQLSLEAGQNLPGWFSQQAFARHLRVINSTVLFNPSYAGLADWSDKEITIKISSTERAMLEYCHLLPKYADFEEARQLMEGLTTLRPELMQSLLYACQSVKAKRLFLALASVVGHAWYQQLDVEKLNLGTGNRSVLSNGILHPQYKITVPEEWMNAGTEQGEFK